MNFLAYVVGFLLILVFFVAADISGNHAEQRETTALRTKLAEKAGPPSDVSFTWWLPQSVQPGTAATVTVQARRHGRAVAVSCTLNGVRSVTQLNAAVLSWTAGAPGSGVMTCSAAGRTDMRLLAIGKI